MQYNIIILILSTVFLSCSHTMLSMVRIPCALKNFHVVTPCFQEGFYPGLQSDIKVDSDAMIESSGEKNILIPKLSSHEALKKSTLSQSDRLCKKLQKLDVLYFAKMVEYEKVTTSINDNAAWKNNYSFALKHRAGELKALRKHDEDDEQAQACVVHDAKIDTLVSRIKSCEDMIKQYTPQKLAIEKSLQMLQAEIYSVERSCDQYEDALQLQAQRLFEQRYTLGDCQDELRSKIFEEELSKNIDKNRRVYIALALAKKSQQACA